MPTVDVLVNGGHATAAPPIGPALAPLGINVGKVVEEINKKTKDFDGIQVPVKIVVKGKDFDIIVGTPPVSALIKKELKLEKGSGQAGKEEVADILIEQVIKIAKMKEATMLGKDLKTRVKQVIGTCKSMGVLVEGKDPKTVIEEINNGKYDEEISKEKTELSKEELKQLEEEKKKLKDEIEKHHEEIKAKALSILNEMKGKDKSEIRKKMKDAEIPSNIIDELVPREEESGK